MDEAAYILKELAYAGLAQNILGLSFYYFRYKSSVVLISAFGPFQIHQFKTNCGGVKIDWGLPRGMQLFTECILCHNILFYTLHIFVDSACKHLTVIAHDLFRPNNNFMSFFE